MEKMLANERIESRIMEVENQTFELQQCLSPELLEGIQSKDFIKIISGLHKQLVMLRR